MLTVRSPIGGGALDRSGLRTNASLRRSLERLASGLRINQAADDAAGLGVSTDLRTDLRSTRMALRNVEDAIEMTRVAEGGLHSITDMLQRMRELAVASSSETLADEERQYLQDEYGELLAELDRTANSAHFGNNKLLAPGDVDVLFMIDLSDSMGLEIPAFRSAIPIMRQTMLDAGLDVKMGLVGVSNSSDAIDGATVYQELTGDTDQFDAVLSGFDTTGLGLMDPYTTMLDQTGLVPVAGTDGPESNGFRGTADQKLILYASDRGQEVALTGATEADAAQALADGGFTVHAMTALGAFGSEFDDITTATGGTLQDMNGFGVGFDAMLDTIAQDAIANARPTTPLEVQAGIHGTADDLITLSIPTDVTSHTLGITDSDVATVATAREALDLLDVAIGTVSSSLAELGGSQVRLEATARNHEETIAALAGAESKIRDADMADLTSELTALQIMQQAGIAARAQAKNLHSASIPALLG